MDGQLLIVEHTGKTEWVTNSYGGIKAAMGGRTIDFVCHDQLGCYINDNGMLDSEPLNWIASIMMFRPLYGPVVFTAPEPDDEGDTLPANEGVYNAILNLAGIVGQVRLGAAQIGQKIDVHADPDTIPPPIIVGLTPDFNFGDPLPTEQPPVCPACHAEAAWTGKLWETAHALDCAWMQNPESESY